MPTPVPVPPLALSDALLFCDLESGTLETLADCSETWQHAIVLATPLWDRQGQDKLPLFPIDLSDGISSLQTASIRFDTDRDVQVSSYDFKLNEVSIADRCIIHEVRSVHIVDQVSSEALAGLTQLMPNVSALHMCACEGVSTLLPLASLVSLKTLELDGCGGLRDYSALATLSMLTDLEIGEAEHLDSLAVLVSSASTLQTLRLGHCEALEDITDLSSLTNINTLELSGCISIVEVSALTSACSLKHLSISGAHNLHDFSPLSSLAGLVSLTIVGCHFLRDLPGLSSLSSLEHLSISHCLQLANSGGMGSPVKLKNLRLFQNTELTDLPQLSSLTSLRSLAVFGCDRLQSISPMSSSVALVSLNLRGCVD